MDKTDLSNLIAEQERQAIGYHGGDLSKERTKALDYYNGRPLGNEVEGRSQVVSSDVFDVVEGMLPVVVKMFAATNTAVEFDPSGMEDEAAAKQATAACNYVFYKQNNGVLILYTWFKDALLQKNGVVKWYYEDKTDVAEETYEGLNQAEFERLVSDEAVEVLEHTEYVDPQAASLKAAVAQMAMPMLQQVMPQAMLHDVKVKVTKQSGKVCVDPIPPEEFIVAPGHHSIDLEDCPFCAHRSKKTISYLKSIGFSDDDLKDIGDGDNDGRWNAERQARNLYAEEQDPEVGQTGDPSMREVWVSEGYIRADQDGDGIAELIRFIKAGNKVLEDKVVDSIDFAALTPIVMPHRFVGKSFADVTMDFQTVNTTLWRQGLDNLYLTNNPRHAVLEHQANLDDLLTSRPGGIVRMRTPDAVTPLITPFVAQHIFPMLEYNESRKENRTGVTRYNQGTDGDTLNKTAHGVQMIQNASMQRAELVGRMFAETGVKRLFRGIKRTLYKSGLKKLSIRLNGEYVDVDPREWKTEWDMTINVGLGTGNKDQQLAHLQRIFGQLAATAQMGKGYMISDENLYNLNAKVIENSGFQHVEAFITHPKSVPDEAKKPPPAPEMLKLQMDTQLSQAKLQSSEKQKFADLQVTKSIEDQNAQIERYKAELEVQSKERIALAQIEADKEIEAMKIRASAEMEVFRANNQADMKVAEMAHSSSLEDKRAEAKKTPTKAVQFNAKEELAGVASALTGAAASIKAIAETKANDVGQAAQALTGAVQKIEGVAKGIERMAGVLATKPEPKSKVKKGVFNGKPFEIREE